MTRLRIAVLALIAFIACFTGSTTPAAAQVSVGVRVGSPPPPVVVERRWHRPYRGAVWIGGHHEWVNGGWVWVGGYYSYPPRPHGYWVPSRWHRGYYYPGHWAY